MFFSSAVLLAAATFSALITAAPTEVAKLTTPLSVSVSPAGNAMVKVTMTNLGATDLSLYKYGTILEAGPVQKVMVLKDGAVLQHEGVLRRYLTKDLTAEAFTTLTAGQTISETIDLASVADLSAGGVYEVVAAGAIPLATTGTTTLSGQAVTYDSNKLSITVNGAAAAKVEKAVKALVDRTILSSCSSTQNTATRAALANTVTLANNAANAAASGSATKFSEYFKTTLQTTRNTVAARLRAVASQASSVTSGSTRYYCSDVYGDCSSGVLAYTIPSQNIIANCPLYYSALPSLTRTCHAQDQTTTSLHEFTHAPGTFSPGTLDNAYGYSASVALSSSQAVLNADTYALYSNAIYVGC